MVGSPPEAGMEQRLQAALDQVIPDEGPLRGGYFLGCSTYDESVDSASGDVYQEEASARKRAVELANQRVRILPQSVLGAAESGLVNSRDVPDLILCRRANFRNSPISSWSAQQQHLFDNAIRVFPLVNRHSRKLLQSDDSRSRVHCDRQAPPWPRICPTSSIDGRCGSFPNESKAALKFSRSTTARFLRRRATTDAH